MSNGKHHHKPRYKQRHRPKHLVPNAAAMQARKQARDCAVAATGLVVVAASLAVAAEPQSFAGVAQQRSASAFPLPTPRAELKQSASPRTTAAGAGSGTAVVSQVDESLAPSFAWAQLNDPDRLNRDLRETASAEPKHFEHTTSAEPSKVRPSPTVSGANSGPVLVADGHDGEPLSPASSSTEPHPTPTISEPRHIEPAHVPATGSGSSPEPSPAPSGQSSSTTGCVAHPSSCGYPDATNTGASGTLTPSGPINSTTDGEVIANLAVSGHITVTSANVTIKNVRIVGDNGLAAIDAHAATGPLTIDHVTISYPQGVYPISAGAIWGGNALTVTASDISGSPDGIDASGRSVLIQDNWIHNLQYNAAKATHDDDIQTLGGDVTIRHNTLDATAPASNSCLQIGNLLGSLSQLTFANNLCNGGGYSINANPANVLSGVVKAGTLTFVGNRFGTAYRYGVSAHLVAPFVVVWNSNVDDATGAAVR